ncbi:MAG: hypothetical protein ABI548_02980 [Polyangiaceae bacterium]
MIKQILAAGVLLAAMQGCGSDSTSSMGAGAASTDLGPGAALKCTSSGMNAWDTFGADAFVAVNESIFTLVVGDTSGKLGGAFGKIGTGMPASTTDDLATFKGNLAAFLVYAYGGPTSIKYTDGKTYHGPQSMPEAHAGLAITSDQYDYFIMNQVVPALTMNGVTMDDVSSCFAPIVTDPDFKASIVGK